MNKELSDITIDDLYILLCSYEEKGMTVRVESVSFFSEDGGTDMSINLNIF